MQRGEMRRRPRTRADFSKFGCVCAPRRSLPGMQYSAAARSTKASKSWAHILKEAGLVHKETGLTLESAEFGSVKITDSFVDSETSRLRLQIECPADRKGRLPVTLSPTGNIVDRISSRSDVAKEGLLRKGDTVIGVDGVALGQTTLEQALSKNKTIHTLIVHRTDAQLTSIVMKTPPMGISTTFAAPFFRVQIDLTRCVGRSDTVRLGLNVNQYNGIVYIVPGSPVAYEGSLTVGDVLVELNGKPLGDAWLVDLLDDEPLQGEPLRLRLRLRLRLSLTPPPPRGPAPSSPQPPPSAHSSAPPSLSPAPSPSPSLKPPAPNLPRRVVHAGRSPPAEHAQGRGLACQGGEGQPRARLPPAAVGREEDQLGRQQPVGRSARRPRDLTRRPARRAADCGGA